MRKPIIAANWKMHKTHTETEIFLENFTSDAEKIEEVEIVIAPPFTALTTARNHLKETNVKTCAQNIYYEEQGAFTGEISPLMLKDTGCEYVIVGHSERRNIFNETDDLINKKLRAVLDHEMKPILCIGESEKERAEGKTTKVLENQLDKGLAGLEADEMEKVVIAYEPIWAIGTGESASPDDAQEGCLTAREKVADLFGSETAEKVRLQYGGSIKPHNAEKLMTQDDIDGGLIGSASLEPDSFYSIIKTTEKIS